MTPGDPLQADQVDAEIEGAEELLDAGPAPVKADEPAEAPIEPDEPLEASNDEAAPESISDEAEAMDDDAWMDACRTEPSDPEETDPSSEDEAPHTNSDSTDAQSADLETPDFDDDEGDTEATLTDEIDRAAVIEKTGDDAMSKFGHAIGALAERDLDEEDRAMEFAAETASPSRDRDSGVAPHIAAAERELESSKSSGPVDIFDRIALAAEAQFDDTRGSTAKRVSELVDDRRVGTKRWTPSKTMKQRMEKLEAARAAATSAAETAAPASEPVVETATVAAAAATAATVVAATAPTSSTATMVTPKADKKPEPESVIAAPAPMQEEQQVVISRRDKQPEIKDEIESESVGATDAAAETEEDPDELRVVPGARGRRRDRARKSRLDEDFEKIFDDEGKPSIGSLRRKLRSTAAAEAEAVAGDGPVAGATSSEEQFGAKGASAKAGGLFSRIFKSKGKKVAAAPQDDDALVEAFEADSSGLSDTLDFDDDVAADATDLDMNSDTIRKQRQIAVPMIGAAGAIGVGGVLYFLWKYLAG